MLTLFLWACSSNPAPTVQPLTSDKGVTLSAAEALCKLHEGAGRACNATSSAIEVDGQSYSVEATVVFEEGPGMVILRGNVAVGTPGQPFISRMRGFGGTKSEATQRTMHEWALVSGTAVVDHWLGAKERPALRAVEATYDGSALQVSGRPVLRGWTLHRPRGQMKHQELLTAIASVVPAVPGVISFEVIRQAGETKVECWWQGRKNPAICKSARAWTWPIGEYELRSAYLITE